MIRPGSHHRFLSQQRLAPRIKHVYIVYLSHIGSMYGYVYGIFIHIQTFRCFLMISIGKSLIWAIYSDLSRRLVTPNGGEK